MSPINWKESDLTSINILGVKVGCIDQPTLLETVTQWARSRDRRTVMYVNAHCLNMACADPSYRSVLNRADLVYADGIGVQWASRLMGDGRVKKATGSEWIDDLCRLLEENGLRMYILAGRPGVAEQARQNLIASFPRLNVTGAADGFFSEKSETEILAEIGQAKPDLLFVGMGTPRQELWVTQHRDAIAAPVCWVVGSLFDLVAGVEPWPPAWANRLALQWFWRLMMDPVGKYRRYVLGNPLFILRVLRQKFAPGVQPAPEISLN